MSSSPRGAVTGYRCATCGARVPIDTLYPFTCPSAPAGDSHHVLHPVTDGPVPELIDDPNPFVTYGPSLAWWAFARDRGMSEEQCVALTREIADGFHVTPCGPQELLSSALGAQVWVKNETGNVGGSHKARHLVTILLHLRAAEELGAASGPRAPLAIASCGNAAIAASTLAKAAGWPIDVFVPDTAADVVIETLESLGAHVDTCPRTPAGPKGDPAVLTFRQAVADGAIPFSVQGPENGLCLDGGRTIGWELAQVLPSGTRVLIQVGGGAFAACVGWGLGSGFRLDTVQTEGGAPLQRAWQRVGDVATGELGARWGEFMTAWDNPSSLADGILDDETYDWQADIEVMRACGGQPIVVSEQAVEEAFELAASTGIPVSPTGSAALAALLPGDDGPVVTPGEPVAIVFSGVQR
ncbi:MAG: PLP-dependent lyase/thiolase [Dermatophilaceae bacterium]